jgi:uncharacterized delta-60 repeat protein
MGRGQLLLVGLWALLAAAAPAAARPGDFDRSFGDGGVAVGPGGSPLNQIESMALEPDGGLSVVGDGQRFGGYGTVLAKLRPGGEYDTGFGWDGHAPSDLNLGPPGFIRQPDGKLLLAGELSYPGSRPLEVGVERFLADGDPDPSFGTGGRVRSSEWGAGPPSWGYPAVTLDSRGRIVLAMFADTQADTVFLVRLLPDGSLDVTFGGDGVVRRTLPFGGSVYGVV